MVDSVSLKPWVSALNQFQKLYLVNKAVLELVGHDVPVIALAKNNDERKERYFRQALVFFFVFLIAPLHARFINHAFSKGVAPPPVLKALAKAGVSSDTLMKLPSTALQSTKALGKGLRMFFNETLGKPMPAVLARAVGEPLRKRMVRAKTAFLMTDLALQGGFFMSIGWLKNLFAKRFLTGSMQFSGERGIVAQNKLDKLYEAQQRRQQELAAQQEAARQEQLRQEQAQREAAASAAAAELARTDAELVTAYSAVIHDLVQQNWSRPPSARNGMVAVLRIQMVPTGDILNVEVVQSSGDYAFDRAAETAVLKVRRFSELQGMDIRLFERNFRTFLLTFRPQDLLN